MNTRVHVSQGWGRGALWRACLLLLAIAAAALAATTPTYATPDATIIRVVPGGAGDKTGADWDNAKDLADALSSASSGSELWVQAGTYMPTAGLDRTATFALKNGVALYGGFAGGETALGQRDWRTNVTTLSGDLNGNDGPDFANNSENVYHVVTGSGTDSSAILDGFTVSGANANGTYPNSCGGGMYNYTGSPKLANVTFSSNFAISGGGMINWLNSDPTLTNVVFSGNSGDNGKGGGMYNFESSPTLTNVVFSGNSAPDGAGGGMFNGNSSSPTLTNVTFSGNSAYYYGGAVYNESSNPMIRNSILWGDTGGEVYGWDSTPTFSHSIVQGSSDTSNGNLNANPLFITVVPPAPSTGGNLRLGAGSPAINAGDNTLIPNDVTTDLDGHPRIAYGTVDMGAYESPCPGGAAATLYVNASVPSGGLGDGSSWANAYTTLSAALTTAQACANVTQVWVATGTYTPTTGTDRNATFQLKNNLAIYGGFIGGEGALGDRNWRTHVTTLSGDIGTTGNTTDNSYHVVTGSNTANTAILDGFTISGGNASVNGFCPGPSCGGGMYNDSGNPTLTNVTFSGNSAFYGGGGIYNFGGSSTLTNVVFSGNSVTLYGGGMLTNGSSARLTNVVFSGNSAQEGGGMDIWSSNLTLSNVTFGGNSASDYGGGMYNWGAILTVRNSILWGNSAGIGGPEIYNDNSTPTFSHSIVQGSSDTSNGNLNADPKFVTAVPSPAPSTGGNLRLGAGSPAINAGDNTFIPNGVTTDLDGNPRIAGSIVDMGAYEVQDSTPPTVSVTCNGGTCATTWYTTNVSVVWTLTETESRVLFSAGCDATTISSDTPAAGTTLTCSATSVGGTSAPVSVTIKRDATAPTTTITGKPANPTNSPSASFTFDASDGNGSGVAGFECSLDGGSFAPCASPQSYTGLTEGSHTFQVHAVDNAGNVDATPDSYTWVIDTTPPTTTIDAASKPANPTNNTSAGFAFSTGDGSGSGVASYQCKLDGGSFAPCTSPQNYTNLADGSHTFTVQATDHAGNTETPGASFTWTVDTTPPTTTITGKPANPTNSTSAGFTFSAGDGSGSGVASYQCQLDGSSFAPCASGVNYTGLTDGSHTFTVKATDNAGNAETPGASTTWTVDTVAPTVTINQAAGQADPTSSSPVHFTVVFSEPVTDFTSADVTLSGTANATTAVVTQSAPNNGTTYDGAVSGMTATGAVIAAIPANAAHDAAGNGNAASTATDNTITFNAVIVTYVSPTLGPPSVNAVYPSGSGPWTTPAKWRMARPTGEAITTGTVAAVRTASMACGAALPTYSDSLPLASGFSSANPRYDAYQRVWLFNWQLPGRNACYALFVKLSTGTVIPFLYNIH